MITGAARELALDLPELPAYVHDLAALESQLAGIRADLAGAAELYYAAKANPQEPILATAGPLVDGVEVASGGELVHVRRALPQARLAFGGPGKTEAELAAALAARVHRVHVESPHELARLAALGRPVQVLLRVNLPGARTGAALAMSGPFGMDPTLIFECLPLLAAHPHVALRGVHAHLASGLDAPAMAAQSAAILAWARPFLHAAGVTEPEIDLGGGMAVDYADPAWRFDWRAYGSALARLREPGETLRIEPGRAISVHSGWYVTDVLDVKIAHGEAYAVLRGGTHHLRTPATKGHDQPFLVLPVPGTGEPSVEGRPVTLVGQLCTPKDVLARRRPVARLAVGDRVVFAMAGAYAWNISHHEFLMHPRPGFHYCGGSRSSGC